MSGAMSDEPQLSFEQSADPLQNSLLKSGLDAPVEDTGPVYRVMADSKIVVSKARGKLVKSRIDAVKKMMENDVAAWDEAIRYYNSSHSDDGTEHEPSRKARRVRAGRLQNTENMVFGNVSSAVPQLYAKNPIVSMASGPNDEDQARDESDAFARAVEKLVNVLLAMTGAPGVNAKPKFKRAVLLCLLTNAVWLEVGYTKKDASSEQALADLQDVSMRLMKAKNAKEIQRCEGELIALEEKVEFLNPSGPFLRVRLPHQVLIDPDHNDSNGADAKWIAVEDMLPTDYLNAVYGTVDTNTGKVTSIYEPTHILDGGGSNEADDIRSENFTIFQEQKKSYNAYGYQDANSFNKAKRTKVWYYWDRVTKRLELYADNSWKWPIWVWDDPYQLQGFFPLTKLWFHENPIGTFGKGEVSYYLEQQDMLNEINDEKRKWVKNAKGKYVYNINKVSGTEVEKLLKEPDETATGVDAPEGGKIKDIIEIFSPPSAGMKDVFNKDDLYKSMDRIAATSEVMRGGEFKTNTTNKAVEYYSTMGNNRNDARLDALEDCIGRVGWQIAQLCLRFMDAQTVQQLIGQDVSEVWRPIDPTTDLNRFSMTCIGGSTTKMSASARKQEAVQVGQILSQFVKAAPASVLTKTLDIFSKAFDDVLMSKTDWTEIQQEVAKTLQMTAGGAPGQVPPGGGAQLGSPGAQPSSGGGGGGGASPQAIVQTLSQLPPPLLQAIGVGLAKGLTPEQVLAEIAKHVPQGQQQPTPQQPQQGAQ